MRFKLRPYQNEFIDGVIEAYNDGHNRILGVAATGAGKTIIASHLMSMASGRCLFLADSKELVFQNSIKYDQYTGDTSGIEMGKHHCNLERDRVVVATSQSLHRRLEKFPKDFFSIIIIDEAHRNTLGAMSQKVIHYFPGAKVLGLTATPTRSDRKDLGDFYEKIASEVGMQRLMLEGHLSRIVINRIPMSVDLRQVKSTRGDYKIDELGEIVAPVLSEAANQIKEHAADRKKIVVFLPLISIAKQMSDILNSIGIKSVAVSGEDREGLNDFVNGDAQAICNAQLLSTGWDCPPVDCIMVLRPTKSISLYQQMIGRGTRNSMGKTNLLILDPLYLSEDHRVITPARLVATSVDEAQDLSVAFQTECGEEVDLLETHDSIKEKRMAALEARARAKEKKKAKFVDVLAFSLNADDKSLAQYEAEFVWEEQPPTEKQSEVLTKAGFDIDEVGGRGKASKLIDLLFSRRRQGLATPKQLRILKRMNIQNAANISFQEASKIIDSFFSKSNTHNIHTS